MVRPWILASIAFAMITPSAHAESFAVLHAFAGAGAQDGAFPDAMLALDAQGALYGTTLQGGDPVCNCGTIFRLAPDGTETVLYAFTNHNDGAYPDSDLVADASGNRYGTASSGGTGCMRLGCGTIYRLSRGGKLKTLYRFLGTGDGFGPEGELSIDADGNLYGTTGGDRRGIGATIFKFSHGGTLTTLYTFKNRPYGKLPIGGVVRDAAGSLYGTTYYGGDVSCSRRGCGVVYKLAVDGAYTVLHAFHDYPQGDGANPEAGITLDRKGNIYGTTRYGGSMDCRCGTIFRLTPGGKEKILHEFGIQQGKEPPIALTLVKGTLYGGVGTVAFKLALDGSYNILHQFAGDDGDAPAARMIVRHGVLYGVARYAGAHANGTAYQLAE